MLSVFVSNRALAYSSRKGANASKTRKSVQKYQMNHTNLESVPKRFLFVNSRYQFSVKSLLNIYRL